MQALNSYLERTGTSQTEFGRQVGVSQPTISDILRGVHSPSVALLRKISKKTGISIDELLANETARVSRRLRQ